MVSHALPSTHRICNPTLSKVDEGTGFEAANPVERALRVVTAKVEQALQISSLDPELEKHIWNILGSS